MNKAKVLILSGLIFSTLSLAHHGGNSSHNVCFGTVALPGEQFKKAQKIAFLLDNLRQGADTWVNVVRGVLGLEDYVGVAKDSPGAKIKIVNTESEITNDVLFDGSIEKVDGGLALKGKLKVDRGSPSTIVNVDTVFECTDITPMGIPNKLPSVIE